MRGRLKLFVINYLTRHLLKTILVEDLFRKEGNGWYIGRHRLTPEELNDLKAEADSLLESEIWKLMTREITWRSNLQMFEKARNENDIVFGKAQLYNWELAQKFLEQVRSL